MHSTSISIASTRALRHLATRRGIILAIGKFYPVSYDRETVLKIVREHNTVRFQNGTPISIWYSQHSYGAAYTYNYVRKVGLRPVVFSARGSHANYAVSGAHDMHNFGTSPGFCS
jgi:hypothetical protein